MVIRSEINTAIKEHTLSGIPECAEKRTRPPRLVIGTLYTSPCGVRINYFHEDPNQYLVSGVSDPRSELSITETQKGTRFKEWQVAQRNPDALRAEVGSELDWAPFELDETQQYTAVRSTWSDGSPHIHESTRISTNPERTYRALARLNTLLVRVYAEHTNAELV